MGRPDVLPSGHACLMTPGRRAAHARHMHHTHTHILASAALALGLVVASCGDDDDTEGSLDSYCDVAAELASAGETPPTVEQLDRIRETAPDEIRPDIETAADTLEANLDALEAGDTSVFEDPELGAAFERIQAFDRENCDATP